jgi:cell wall assembly regulator SMI1
MQSFENGAPPPPPVSHSWKRIDAWADENYPELLDQLGEGATTNDINELEHMLDCSLPPDVRESLQIHDGQERGGRPTGIIFSSMLLDCEEMVQEWQNWRTVNEEILLDKSMPTTALPSKALGGSSSIASSSQAGPSNQAPQPQQRDWKQELMSRQDCVPTNAVQKLYSHPAWIPLVRDWGGNNLAVDLAPGPSGHWGQIILFGRDYDTKYVVARSWAAFLAVVANDLNSGKWFVDEETNELKLREFKETRIEPAYFAILRWRMDQKYGRRAITNAKRKSVVSNPGGSGLGGASSPTGSASPYASPSEPNGDLRGRPLQRLSANSPLSSPVRPTQTKPTPLARVAEESGAPLEVTIPNGLDLKSRDRLVEVETPRPSGDENQMPRLAALTNGEATPTPNGSSATVTSPLSAKANGKLPATVAEEPMNNIEI